MMKRCCCLVLALLLCVVMSAAALADMYRVGDRMDDFSVTLCDGATVSLYSLLRDHDAVLIHLWATWSAPCRNGFPALQQAYQRMGGSVPMLALSIEPSDTMAALNAFRDAYGVTVPMGQDTASLGQRVDMYGIPTSVLVDRSGVIRWIETGAVDSADDLQQKIVSALGR